MVSRYGKLLKMTAMAWWQDKAPRLGAALAFYSVLSLGPLLLLTVAIAGTVFGEEAARGQITQQIEGLIGEDGSSVIQTLLANSRAADDNLWAALIGLGTLLLAASGVFGELQDALNTIWKVQPPKDHTMLQFFKRRFMSFSMVLCIGFLLMVSLALTALLNGLSAYITARLPAIASFLVITDFALTFGIITLLFAMIFKILPDTHIHWRDIWIGAVITSILFGIGKYFIGLYLGQSAVSSTYGAAGSLIVLIIWIYYSAQILYFGAEFTKVYAETIGSKRKGLHDPAHIH